MIVAVPLLDALLDLFHGEVREVVVEVDVKAKVDAEKAVGIEVVGKRVQLSLDGGDSRVCTELHIPNHKITNHLQKCSCTRAVCTSI